MRSRRTWTPVLTFATAGDLAVTYSSQSGIYAREGRLVMLQYNVVTSAFTHTTASGNLQLTGLPMPSLVTAGTGVRGAVEWSGITKANYTAIVSSLGANESFLEFFASGSGQASSRVAAADMPTGGSVILRGTHWYFI